MSMSLINPSCTYIAVCYSLRMVGGGGSSKIQLGREGASGTLQLGGGGGGGKKKVSGLPNRYKSNWKSPTHPFRNFKKFYNSLESDLNSNI